MRKKALYLASLLVVLSAFFCLAAAQTGIPSSLRGGIEVDEETIRIALVMRGQGWEYIMPRPKSPEAAWGNTDGRTTWWVGHWINEETEHSSSVTPWLEDGKYVGDGQGVPGWRRGGTPLRPTKLEWLLSKDGGIEPLN